MTSTHGLPDLSLLACPQCGGSLSEAQNEVRCEVCDARFPFREGALSFSKSAFYWGDMKIQQDKMSRLAEVARQEGWESAVRLANENLKADTFIDFLQYTTNQGRCGWKLLAHLPREGVAFDIGCGWGTLALSLAENFRVVLAMDLTWEKAAIVSARARQSHLSNVIAMHGGDSPKLPVATGSVDLVVLNGVLEWVPKGCAGNPRDVQKAFLREVHRILRPTGQVYIGIENRMGFRYFLGHPEEHSGLKFVSLLPRFLANLYARSKTGEAYQTYTYTVSGYRKLLHEAGFEGFRAYSPYPDYRDFSNLIDLQDSQQLAQSLRPRSRKGRLALALLKTIHGFRYVTPSYGLIGSKSASTKGFLAQLLDTLNSQLPGNGSERLRVETIRITQTETALVFMRRGSASYTLRIPLSRAAARRVAALGQNLRCLADDDATRPFRQWLPLVFAEGRFENQSYLVHAYFPGFSRDAERADIAKTRKLESEAVRALCVIHQASRSRRVELKTAVTDLCKRASETLLAVGCPNEQMAAFRDLEGQLLEASTGDLPLVVSHGDYGLPNLVFSEQDDTLQGILDWDAATLEGYPLMDLLRLLTDYEKQMQGTQDFCGAYRFLLEQFARQDSFEQKLLSQYLAAVPLSPTAVESFVLLFPMYLISSSYDLLKGTAKNKLKLCTGYFADLAGTISLAREIASRRGSIAG